MLGVSRHSQNTAFTPKLRLRAVKNGTCVCLPTRLPQCPMTRSFVGRPAAASVLVADHASAARASLASVRYISYPRGRRPALGESTGSRRDAPALPPSLIVVVRPAAASLVASSAARRLLSWSGLLTALIGPVSRLAATVASPLRLLPAVPRPVPLLTALTADVSHRPRTVPRPVARLAAAVACAVRRVRGRALGRPVSRLSALTAGTLRDVVALVRGVAHFAAPNAGRLGAILGLVRDGAATVARRHCAADARELAHEGRRRRPRPRRAPCLAQAAGRVAEKAKHDDVTRSRPRPFFRLCPFRSPPACPRK